MEVKGKGGDEVQLAAERRTGKSLTQIRLPGRWGEGFFSHSQLSVQTLLRVSIHPRAQSHALIYVSTLQVL